MANIVHDLVVELARVQALLSQLSEEQQREAHHLLRFGRESMALNQYEQMREALEDLKALGRKKAEPEP